MHNTVDNSDKELMSLHFLSVDDNYFFSISLTHLGDIQNSVTFSVDGIFGIQFNGHIFIGAKGSSISDPFNAWCRLTTKP